MKVRALASGSGGNAVWFEAGGASYLVDCGISHQDLSRRANACGISLDSLSGIFFTHDHEDHYRGLATFHKRHPQIPFYANGETADAIARLTKVEEGWCTFENAVPFQIGNLIVTPFSIPHDAVDPVGYLFDDGENPFFLGTDMGMALLPMKQALARAVIAVLESNYDPVLLAASQRPLSVKQRIAGRSGHLSNADSAQALREAAPKRLKVLMLAHISQECNGPWRAVEAAEAALKDLKRTGVRVAALAQDTPGELYEC